MFEHSFRERAGHDPVFLVPEYLVKSANPCLFESAVEVLLTDSLSSSAERLLRVSLGRVMPHLLALDPFQHWIEVLLAYDFFASPETGPSDIEEFGPVPSSDDDLHLIVDCLVAMAHQGLLSEDPRDLPHGGRPVLTMNRIEAVEPARWGALKPMLLAELPPAFAAAPPDSWARLAIADPESVVARLLHHIVGRDHQVLSLTEIIWSLIRENHHAYGDAALAALSTVLASSSESSLADLVRYDAGKPAVQDARAWLTALEGALEHGDFSRLVESG